MNVIERQTKVARDLYEINVETMRKMAGLTGDGVRRYVELNSEYLQRITTPGSFGEVMEMQREYGQSLFTGIREDLEQRGQVLREAFEQTSEILRGNWSATQEDLQESAEEVGQQIKSVATGVKKAVEDKIDENLEQINGIGHSFAEQLREAGIVTIAQLAAVNLDDLDSESHPLHLLKGRMESEDWVEQARDLLNPLKG